MRAVHAVATKENVGDRSQVAECVIEKPLLEAALPPEAVNWRALPYARR